MPKKKEKRREETRVTILCPPDAPEQLKTELEALIRRSLAKDDEKLDYITITIPNPDLDKVILSRPTWLFVLCMVWMQEWVCQSLKKWLRLHPVVQCEILYQKMSSLRPEDAIDLSEQLEEETGLVRIGPRKRPN